MGTNVANIGTSTFQSCTSLTSITIPTRVTKIGDFEFGYYTSLTTLCYLHENHHP